MRNKTNVPLEYYLVQHNQNETTVSHKKNYHMLPSFLHHFHHTSSSLNLILNTAIILIAILLQLSMLQFCDRSTESRIKTPQIRNKTYA